MRKIESSLEKRLPTQPFQRLSKIILAAMCATAGLALGMFPVMEYVEYRYVYRVPTAILAMGLMVLSVLFSGIALILSNVNNHFMALFEVSMLGRRTGQVRPPLSRKIRVSPGTEAGAKVKDPSYSAI